MSTIARRTMSSSLTSKPSKHRHDAPVRTQVSWPSAARPFVTDGGLETDLIYNRGEELREFAAYPLVRTERGRALLEEYFDGYAAIAREHGTGSCSRRPRGARAPTGERGSATRAASSTT
ncbi:hypothetical protein [Agrococcus lahaulensis]|uniref:hypothetical protein n=1 Tax=Agrococcus lahaulensis TaxID=341722 RepID=UPI001B7FDB03|nr:hypothetical protein [Agrococcus lahaulensis]